MPYIKQENRDKIDPLINPLIDELFKNRNPGDLNYVISRICWSLFETDISYKNGNEIVGVLECAKLEFYRRLLSAYEDQKRKENGDIYDNEQYL